MASTDRLNNMMYRIGGIAACFAILVAAAVLFFINGSPNDELETAAESTTTTTAPEALARVPVDVDEDQTATTTVRPAPVDFGALFDALAELDGPAVPTTTTTTTTTTVAPASGAATGPSAVSIGRPSCAAGLGGAVSQTGPFTGTSASIPAGMPAVVVKVSNNSSASRRALIGLDQADIVFEERIEASATRFAAVFHSQLPPNVGPVRSGRTTDINLLRPLGVPVLGYSGSNPGVAGQFNTAKANGWFVPYINTDRAPFARDGRYTAPDNLFVDPASLGACGNGGTPQAVFRYGGANSTTAQPASNVSLDARSPFRFDWDSGSARWIRSQSGSVHRTREGAALAPKNVVVMFVNYIPSQIDASSVDAQTTGSGTAWILRDGTITVGTWQRANATTPFTLGDGAGTRVNLAPGQTWVVLQPNGAASWN